MTRPRAAALLVCLAVLAANARHLLLDAAPPAWDDAWYLEISFRLYRALVAGPLAFAREYADAFRIKAPLIAVLPLPLYLVGGPSERLAPWINQPLLAATWYFLYRIGRKLYGERAGLCAAAAGALIPILYGLSRLLLVECALAAAVCWAQWLVLSSGDGKRRGVELGLALGFGLLLKSLFPLYLLGTVWLRRRELRPHAKTALCVGGALASTWYAFNLPYVVGFGLSAGFGAIGRDYGVLGALSPAAIAGYAKGLLGQALSWPLCLGAALTAAAAWRGGYRRPGPAERFLLAWLLFPLAVLALGVNKDLRYAVPALPALAVLAGAAADRALALGRAWAPAAGAALGLLVLSAQNLGVPAMPALNYNEPASRDPGWDRAAVVEALAAWTAGWGGETVTAVALEHRLFNANNLASLAAARGLRGRFVNLGYAQASAEGALIRLKDKGATHLILVEGALPGDLPGFLNRANEGVRQAMRSGRLPARMLTEVPLAPGLRAVLYALERA